MSTFNHVRLRIEGLVTCILLGLLIAFVFTAAVLRWVNISIVWSVDIAQFLFTWLCFIGADLAYYHNKHMGVDLVKNRLGNRGRTYLEIIINLIVMVFVASIFFYGMKLSINNYVRKFNALPISYSYATIAAPIGAFLMFLSGIDKLKKSIGTLRMTETSAVKQS